MHTRECGSQSAHQSLITDVLQVSSPPLRVHRYEPALRSGGIVASKSLTADIRAGHPLGDLPDAPASGSLAHGSVDPPKTDDRLVSRPRTSPEGRCERRPAHPR